jgi:PEP-CTERM motif
MTTRRRLLAITCAVGLAVTLMARPASAATILVFGQSGAGNLFTGDETMGTTVLSSVNAPVTITTLNQLPSVLPAFFNLSATSIGPAMQAPAFPGAWTQQYSGSFSFSQSAGGGGTNYLSGTFTGITLGVVGGNQLVLGAGTTPPLALTFTSDIMGMPLGTPRAMALSLTNVLPAISISNNSFADFGSNVAGDFSAEILEQPPVIPEPASMFMLASGLVGLAAAARRRQKSARKRQEA